MASTEKGSKQFSRAIMPVGKTGNGKSSLGNSLLAADTQDPFEETPHNRWADDTQDQFEETPHNRLAADTLDPFEETPHNRLVVNVTPGISKRMQYTSWVMSTFADNKIVDPFKADNDTQDPFEETHHNIWRKCNCTFAVSETQDPFEETQHTILVVLDTPGLFEETPYIGWVRYIHGHYYKNRGGYYFPRELSDISNFKRPFLLVLDPRSVDMCFKATSMRSEDEYSVIQKFRKQTQKSRKSQLIDFWSLFHEIQEMVLYKTKITVTESRINASGCTDPYRDIYRTSTYLLILFGLTAFEEKQALEQVMESMWKHIFWNESLSTYFLSDNNEKETKDAEESITSSGKELLKYKNVAPVEVSVTIDNVSMEDQPTAGSYDKQAAEEFLALEQMLMCKVCLDVDICIVFLPCRHTATCESCASVLQSCPVCRSEIQASIKLNYE